MNLLIDIGNYRMKWGCWDGEALTGTGAAIHNGCLPEVFASLMAQWSAPARILVSSVASPALNQALREAARQQWGGTCEYLVSPAQAFGVRNAYANPETLGADRWAVLLGAMAQGLTPACIVDCGTAVTVDVLDASGQHHGGVIFAGLRISREALHGSAHRLTAAGEGKLPVLATDTVTAIRSGTVQALTGAVEHLIGKVAAELAQQPRVILTGGDAQLIAGALSRHAPLVQPDLVLRGLAAMLEKT